MKKTLSIVLIIVCMFICVMGGTITSDAAGNNFVGFEQAYDSSGMGICTVVSVGTLINRRIALENRYPSDQITFEGTMKCIVSNVRVVGTKNGCLKYSYSGATSTKIFRDGTVYYSLGGVPYTMGYSTISAENKNEQYIRNMLDTHPEGIAVRCHYATDSDHNIVLTRYEIVNGKMQVYVQDGCGNKNFSQRGVEMRYEDSWMASKVPSFSSFVAKMTHVWYVKSSGALDYRIVSQLNAPTSIKYKSCFGLRGELVLGQSVKSVSAYIDTGRSCVYYTEVMNTGSGRVVIKDSAINNNILFNRLGRSSSYRYIVRINYYDGRTVEIMNQAFSVY